MDKKLPKVFANTIEKEINNNEKVYTSTSQEEKQSSEQQKKQTNKLEEKKKTIKKPVQQITKKINEIMNTKNYIYKIPVKIILEDKEITTKIIGKNNTNIITIDNQLIQINKIKNIEIYEEKE